MQITSRAYKKFNIALLLTIIFFVMLIRTAWIGDDAGFTFRSIMNFLNGYGPNFNNDERVQSFTHPLWFLLLSLITLITKNPFSAAFICSIGISLAAFWILLTYKRVTPYGVILAGLTLLLSKALVDYSTSGLENPLTNLLLLISIFLANRVFRDITFKNSSQFFLSVSLVYLSRSDALIFIFPLICAVIYSSREQGWMLLKTILLGSTPALIWNLFSLFYYGSFVPNTAYAKLNTGIPIDQLIMQGGLYFIDSLESDFVSLAAILISIVVSFSCSKGRSVALGIIFYLGYVLYIGGDFMSGRFFATPVFLAAYLLSITAYSKTSFRILFIILILFGMANLKSNLLSGSDYTSKTISPAGIVDERGFYYQSYGLLNASLNTFHPIEWPKGIKQNSHHEVMCSGAISTLIGGYPDDTHFIINCALADPLLSRLPINLTEPWRIGHYLRKLPDGYIDSITTDANKIRDQALHSYYEVIRKITKGNLWDFERLKLIFLINFTDHYNPFKSFLKRGIEFNLESIPYFVARYTGIGDKENWGRWSDANTTPIVTIEMLKPLPKNFVLLIQAKGFDQNIGVPTKIRIGNIEKEIVLTGELKSYSVPFSLPAESSKIEIIPPRPISPNEVDSKNQDFRKLGIGLTSISFSI